MEIVDLKSQDLKCFDLPDIKSEFSTNTVNVINIMKQNYKPKKKNLFFVDKYAPSNISESKFHNSLLEKLKNMSILEISEIRDDFIENFYH